MTAVVDASAVVVLLLRLPGAAAVEEELTGDGLVAPAHLDAEVLSALARLSRRGMLDPARAAEQPIAALRRARLRRPCHLCRGAPGPTGTTSLPVTPSTWPWLPASDAAS